MLSSKEPAFLPEISPPPPQKLLQLGLRASPGSAGNRRWERTAEGVGGGRLTGLRSTTGAPRGPHVP